MYYVPDPPLNQLSELPARDAKGRRRNTFGPTHRILRGLLLFSDLREISVRIGTEEHRPWITTDYTLRAYVLEQSTGRLRALNETIEIITTITVINNDSSYYNRRPTHG